MPLGIAASVCGTGDQPRTGDQSHGNLEPVREVSHLPEIQPSVATLSAGAFESAHLSYSPEIAPANGQSSRRRPGSSAGKLLRSVVGTFAEWTPRGLITDHVILETPPTPSISL